MIINGVTMAPPVTPRSVASSSTAPAPMKLPIEKKAWKKLMIGRRRAVSTWTPSAFIATSIAPLPSPISTAPSTATAKLPARAIVTAAGIRIGNAARVTRRAPTASASRPPICIDRMPAAPPKNSMMAIWVASMPSLSRSEGSEPP